jgi:hypothetical protein
MHYGHTAAGAWGVMPHTVNYAMNISKRLRDKYPELAEKAQDVNSNHEKITKFLNENPKASFHVAKAVHKHLNRHLDSDPDKVAYAWYHGLKGAQTAIKEGVDISSNDYVQKFKNYLDQLDGKSAVNMVHKSSDLDKALTAGYGGAGQPTSMVNGAVIQSESLDDGRSKKLKGLRYIVCDKCGDEQVYAKHQVRCRACKSSFGLHNLYKFMKS